MVVPVWKLGRQRRGRPAGRARSGPARAGAAAGRAPRARFRPATRRRGSPARRTTPLSKRSWIRRSDSSRVASVWRVSASSSSSATRASQVLAIEPTSVTCAALRPSSVARYCASAASDRLAMRPKKSSSQAVSARPAWKLFTWSPDVLGARLALTPMPTVGSRSARRMSYCARACSMFSIATRRSRLLAKPVATSSPAASRRRRSVGQSRPRGAAVPTSAAATG